MKTFFNEISTNSFVVNTHPKNNSIAYKKNLTTAYQNLKLP